MNDQPVSFGAPLSIHFVRMDLIRDELGPNVDMFRSVLLEVLPFFSRRIKI
jgi:hypothetical protein